MSAGVGSQKTAKGEEPRYPGTLSGDAKIQQHPAQAGPETRLLKTPWKRQNGSPRATRYSREYDPHGKSLLKCIEEDWFNLFSFRHKARTIPLERRSTGVDSWHIISYYNILCYTISYYVVLYDIILYYIEPYEIASYYTILYYNILYDISLCYTILQYII